MLTTPFHERLAALNQTELWEHWSGYLSAIKYQHSSTVEYFAMRNGAGIFDTSPLFKYRITGQDVAASLAPIFVRDIRECPIGGAQYNIWCNDAGFVVEDGVLLRTGENEFWITTAERNLRYFESLARGGVEIVAQRDEWGMLAIQGPHALSVLQPLTTDLDKLEYFGVTTTSIAGHEVMVSRTGFTGDLGYELWAQRPHGPAVLDAVLEAGADFNAIPVGSRALGMARLEAGLLLLGIDFESARYAWIDAERETPSELGLGWMVPKQSSRSYVGKAAIEAEMAGDTSRWKTTGIIVDAAAYEILYNEEGLIAPKEGIYRTGTQSLYDADFNRSPDARYVGYVTSFMFSPLLKRHIGLAKIPLNLLETGGEVYLELSVSHRPKYVRAEIASTPFFSPKRKTSIHAKDTR